MAIAPLSYGGGQERGLRPGTLPVPLIIGFGLAAELALKNSRERKVRCNAIRAEALAALDPLGIRIHADPERTLPHVLNFSVEGVDSEALMVAIKDLAAVSNGSACTSQNYEPSHVLAAMGLPEKAIAGAVRLSWCHMTPDVDWQGIADRIGSLRTLTCDRPRSTGPSSAVLANSKCAANGSKPEAFLPRDEGQEVHPRGLDYM